MPGSPGVARPSGWPTHRAPRAARVRRRSSCSTSRRPVSPCPLADRRDRRPAGRGARARCDVRDACQPGCAAADRDHRSHRHRQGDVRGAPGADLAVRRFLSFAGDAVLVAHIARFDMGFLDRAVERLTGRRVAAPVVDTVWLARRLLPDGRSGSASHTSRTSSARRSSLSPGTRRCRGHRRDPDRADRPRAGARGGDRRRSRRALAPRARRLHAKRSLVAAAHDPGDLHLSGRNGQALYVGRARDLSARLRSYFSGERQRPAVEAALGALARVEWRRVAASSKPRLTSCGSCESPGRRRTRAVRGPTVMSISAAGATLDCGTSPRCTGPSRGGGSPGGRHVHWRATKATSP